MFTWRQCDQMLELKVTQIFQQLPKVKPRLYFLKNWHTSKYTKKLANIWATFIRKYAAMNFEKVLNLVTLLGTDEMTIIIRSRLSTCS